MRVILSKCVGPSMFGGTSRSGVFVTVVMFFVDVAVGSVAVMFVAVMFVAVMFVAVMFVAVMFVAVMFVAVMFVGCRYGTSLPRV